MTATVGRRAAAAPGVGRRRYSRADWLVLRWQARLDAQWADRVLPWAVAVVLFAVLFSAALARVDRLGAGADLARSVQAAWHLAAGRAPETTVGADVNLFGLRFPIGFVPLAAVTRLLPATATLLAAQAGSLALGVVPLWHLARKVANLRTGAAAAVIFAYACHPALVDLDLGDFHPTTMAMTPLLVAAYAAERRQWRRFTVAAVLAVAWNSELGLVIATMGGLLLLDGERRAGRRAVAAGLTWTIGVVLFVQAPLRTGFVAEDAFRSYGDTGLEVLLEMVRNPFRPLGELLAVANLRLVVWVLGPLLFLSVLSARRLAPAVPLTVLYLIADAPVVGADGGGRTVPLTAFAFVAAPFALARLGRRSIERVLVDRRLLTLLALASVAALVTTSGLAPDADAWRRDVPGEADRRLALAAVPPLVRARVPEALATELADRRTLRILPLADSDAVRLTAGIDALVLDESELRALDERGRFLLRRRIEDRGFELRERAGDLDVFVRLPGG